MIWVTLSDSPNRLSWLCYFCCFCHVTLLFSPCRSSTHWKRIKPPWRWTMEQLSVCRSAAQQRDSEDRRKGELLYRHEGKKHLGNISFSSKSCSPNNLNFSPFTLAKCKWSRFVVVILDCLQRSLSSDFFPAPATSSIMNVYSLVNCLLFIVEWVS